MALSFFYSQLFSKLPVPSESYKNRTVIITGSNTGLGKEAARHYARLGVSKLILAVRSLDKGRAAQRDIEASTGCSTSVIDVWELDMADYSSVQRFASRVHTDLERVDIFLANAGIAKASYERIADNEAMITVNVVSTFLLAALILPTLKATAATFHTRPVLTITSSGAHVSVTFPQRSAPAGQLFATLSDRAVVEKHFDEQYPISKIIEIFAVRSLADKFPAPDYPVTINCVDPGLCESELARDVDSWAFRALKFAIARTTEQGSRTLVHAGAQGPESHGKYLSSCALAEPSAFVRSEEGRLLQGRLWDELVRKLEAIQPGVTGNF